MSTKLPGHDNYFSRVFIPCFLRTDNLSLPLALKSATNLTLLRFRFSKESPMGKNPKVGGRAF